MHRVHGFEKAYRRRFIPLAGECPKYCNSFIICVYLCSSAVKFSSLKREPWLSIKARRYPIAGRMKGSWAAWKVISWADHPHRRTDSATPCALPSACPQPSCGSTARRIAQVNGVAYEIAHFFPGCGGSCAWRICGSINFLRCFFHLAKAEHQHFRKCTADGRHR